jgi:hypothetical protein
VGNGEIEDYQIEEKLATKFSTAFSGYWKSQFGDLGIAEDFPVSIRASFGVLRLSSSKIWKPMSDLELPVIHVRIGRGKA